MQRFKLFSWSFFLPADNYTTLLLFFSTTSPLLYHLLQHFAINVMSSRTTPTKMCRPNFSLQCFVSYLSCTTSNYSFFFKFFSFLFYHQDKRHRYSKGCNNASRAAFSRILHKSDKVCFKCFLKNVEHKPVFCALHRSSSFEHFLIYRFKPDCITANSLGLARHPSAMKWSTSNETVAQVGNMVQCFTHPFEQPLGRPQYLQNLFDLAYVNHNST